MTIQWRNHSRSYGWINIALHWLTLPLVLFLLGSGIYMVTLSYYDPLYHRLPYWHKLLGVLVTGLTLVRIVWRLVDVHPADLPAPQWQLWAGRLVHLAFYVALLGLGITGYIFVTAEGDPIELFAGLAIPAMGTWPSDVADACGWLHRWIAYGMGALILLHTGAALEHHFLQKDATLHRMLWPQR